MIKAGKSFIQTSLYLFGVKRFFSHTYPRVETLSHIMPRMEAVSVALSSLVRVVYPFGLSIRHSPIFFFLAMTKIRKDKGLHLNV